jgi:3-oxoacyl-[acyl-carrier protein] reductase
MTANPNIQFNFSGQHALITGGTRGIGKGIALAFLKAQAHVIVTYKGNEQARAEMEAELSLGEYAALRDKIEFRRCDVTSPEQVRELFLHIEQRYPSLEILINNAGIRKDAVAALMSFEDWQAVIDTNLTGSFLMSKEAIHCFMKNRYGRIINVSSIAGELGIAGQSNYCATKAAQLAMARSMAKEVAKKNITVNCLSPGFIDTDFIADLPAEQLSEYKSKVPMKRLGKVEDVALTALFLASREAHYITGISLETTGGLR